MYCYTAASAAALVSSMALSAELPPGVCGPSELLEARFRRFLSSDRARQLVANCAHRDVYAPPPLLVGPARPKSTTSAGPRRAKRRKRRSSASPRSSLSRSDRASSASSHSSHSSGDSRRSRSSRDDPHANSGFPSLPPLEMFVAGHASAFNTRLQDNAEFHNPHALSTMAQALEVFQHGSCFAPQPRYLDADFFDSLRYAQNSKFAQQKVEEGIQHARQHDYPRAMDCYARALTIEPRHRDAHVARGAAFFNQNNFDEAILCFRKAIDIDPSDPHPNALKYLAAAEQRVLQEKLAKQEQERAEQQSQLNHLKALLKDDLKKRDSHKRHRKHKKQKDKKKKSGKSKESDSRKRKKLGLS